MSPRRLTAGGGHQQTTLHDYILTKLPSRSSPSSITHSHHHSIATTNPYKTTKTKFTKPSQSLLQKTLTDSSDDYLANEPWGDDIEHKSDNTLRVFYQNANGISGADGCLAAKDWAVKMIEHQIDCLGLSETNLAWHLHGNRQNTAHHLKQAWPNQQIRMATSNSSMTFSGRSYQPGGTLQSVGGNWTSHVTTHDSDQLGRWSRLTMRGKQRQIHFVTAYQVTASDGKGTKCASTQQQSLLARETGTERDPRQACEADLTDYIKGLLATPDSHVILQLDANDTMTAQHSWLHRFVTNTGLLDIHHLFHGDENEPSTYIRGSRRIDYILVSPHLVPFVTQCGILPFDSDSDHRPLWLDLSIQQALQCREPPPDLFRETSRGLHSSQKQRATQFKVKLYDHLRRNRFFAKLDELRQLAPVTTIADAEILRRMTALDNTLTQAMLSAENQVRRHWTTQWTPKLRQAKARIQFWKSWVTQLTTKREMTRIRQRAIAKGDATVLPPATYIPTIKEAKQQVRSAIQAYREVRDNSDKIREEFLLEQEYGASVANHRKVKAIKRIRKREALRKTRALLRRVLPKKRSGALTHIKIPQHDPDGNVTGWTTVRDPQSMNDHLKHRNQQHFAQASGTPFATTKARELSRQPFLEAIQDLKSHFRDDGPTSDVLDELDKVYSTSHISAHISGSELEEGFKKWRESTSTSPSGRHLGLYKSLISGDDPIDETSAATDDEPFPLKTKLFEAMATILNTCIDRKLVLPRWQKIVNLMLMKIHNNPRIDKLRVIHLMEADVNMWAGIIAGRRILPAALALDLIGPEQCGSVHNRGTYDVSGVRLFSMLTAQLTQTDMGIFDNDAKACYDRIVLSLFYLRSQQLGFDRLGTNFYDEWMSTAKYFLKTQLGISEEFYQSTIDYYLHGPGQGGRASPPIWVIISALLFLCMNRRSRGATIHDPYFRIHLEHIMQAFVDDSTIWSNQFSLNLTGCHDLEHLAADLQQSAQYWEQLLYVSGGKLELPKCFYYLLSWRFDSEGRPHLRKTQEITPHLTIRDSSTGDATKVPCKDSSAPTKTLGITDNPFHDSNAPSRLLKKKSDAIATALRVHPVSADAAMLLYRTVYIPKMTFGLALAGHTPQALISAQAQMKMTMLNLLGYSKSTPHAVVFGPSDIGGLGLVNLVHEQGLQQVAFVLQCMRSSERLGDYFRVYLRWYQFIAGTSHHVLRRPDLSLPYLPGKWMASLRNFLTDSDTCLEMPSEPTAPMHRLHDQAIMDIALTYTKSRSVLKSINRVRIYLQIYRLSDIVFPHSDIIYKIRCRADIPSKSLLAWPHQPKPGPTSWQAWRTFLATAVHQGYDNRRLIHSLGPWHSPPSDRDWNIRYCPSTDTIYCRRLTTGRFDASFFVSKRCYSQLLPPTDRVLKPPADSYPATPIQRRKVQLPEIQTVTRSRNSATTWRTFLKGLPPWEQTLLANVYFHHDKVYIATVMQSRVLLLASDGGYKDPIGSYGWILATDDEILCGGQGQVFGNPVNSYRAELFGRLAALRFLTLLCSYMDVPTTNLHLESYSDCQSLIRNESRIMTTTDMPRSFYLSPDVDALMLIRDSRLALQCRLRTSHVKSHQDKHTAYTSLSRPSQLNVEADALATEVLQWQTQPVSHLHLPNPCVCICDGIVLTGSVLSQVRRHVTEHAFEKHLCRKHAWTHDNIHDVHWQAYRQKLRLQTQPLQRFVRRLTHDRLPTAVRLFREGQTSSAICPRCESEYEDYDHVLRCSHESACTWRLQFIASLTQWLYVHNTPRDLLSEIASNARTWLEEDATYIDSYQYPIGWDCFFRGFLTTQWSYRVGSSGDQWTANLIQFIWDQTYRAWLLRNNTVDTANLSPAEKLTRQQYLSEINRLYKLKDQCLVSRPFTLPIEQRLLQSNTELADWLTAHRHTIELSHHHYRTLNPLRQTTIREYFHAPRPPDDT